MIDVLWRMRGSVPVGSWAPAETHLGRVSRALVRQGKTITDSGADFIEFRESVFDRLVQPSWRALVMYDKGRVWVDGGVLRYDLSSLNGMIYCVCIAVFVFGMTGFSPDGPRPGLMYAIGAFAWLYGMNVLLALFRVRGFFERAA